MQAFQGWQIISRGKGRQNMATKIICKKFDQRRLLPAIGGLILLILLLFQAMFLPMVQQTAHPLIPSEHVESKPSLPLLTRLAILTAITVVCLLFLFFHPFFRLKPEEQAILIWLHDNNGKKRIYGVINSLKKTNQLFKKMHIRQGYRIIKGLMERGLVELNPLTKDVGLTKDARQMLFKSKPGDY